MDHLLHLVNDADDKCHSCVLIVIFTVNGDVCRDVTEDSEHGDV
jgi:hypothetical protein